MTYSVTLPIAFVNRKQFMKFITNENIMAQIIDSVTPSDMVRVTFHSPSLEALTSFVAEKYARNSITKNEALEMIKIK